MQLNPLDEAVKALNAAERSWMNGEFSPAMYSVLRALALAQVGALALQVQLLNQAEQARAASMLDKLKLNG